MTGNIAKISDRRLKIAAYLLMAALTVAFSLTLYNTISTLDEHGHLANAALLTGRNWEQSIFCTGSFYFKYGTAIFYYFPLLLIGNPVWRYRACLIIISLLVSLSAPIAYTIARNYFKVEDKLHALLIALVATCPPAVLYQSIYTRSDWALVLCCWVVLFSILRVADSAYSRYRIHYTVLASVTAVYAYMCHTRGIVMVIALFLTILLAYLIWRQPTFHIPVYLVCTVGMLVLDRVLTKYFKQQIWATYGRKHSSVEVMDFKFLLKIFTFNGMKIFIKTVIGWFFSICTTTYGVLMVGFVLALVIVFTNLGRKKERKNSMPEILASLYGFLFFAGCMLMSILFLYNFIYNNFMGTNTRRADLVVYERYMVSTMGVLILLALCLLVRRGAVSRRLKLFCLGAQFFCLLCAALSILRLLYGHKINRKMMATLTVLFPYFKDRVHAIIVLGVISLASFALWLLLLKRKKVKLLLIFLLALYLGTFAGTWNILRRSGNVRAEKRMYVNVGKLMSLDGIEEEFPDIFVKKKAIGYVSTYQTSLMDFNLINNRLIEFEDVNNAFVITSKAFKEEVPEGLYQFADLSYDVKHRDCLYVKGEELREALEKRGETLIPAELPQVPDA